MIEDKKISTLQKFIPILLFIVIFVIIIAIFCAFFSGLGISLIIIIFLFGFIVGIFYKELILFCIPNKTLMDIGYIKFFQPHYEKFIKKYLDLLSDNEIDKIIEILYSILEVPLIKDKIEKENKIGNFDANTIKDIQDILKYIIPLCQLLGIDIKKGFGEPVIERFARLISKDKKKGQQMEHINKMEGLLFGISCTNQSKPSIRNVKNELEKLKDSL